MAIVFAFFGVCLGVAGLVLRLREHRRHKPPIRVVDVSNVESLWRQRRRPYDHNRDGL